MTLLVHWLFYVLGTCFHGVFPASPLSLSIGLLFPLPQLSRGLLFSLYCPFFNYWISLSILAIFSALDQELQLILHLWGLWLMLCFGSILFCFAGFRSLVKVSWISIPSALTFLFSVSILNIDWCYIFVAFFIFWSFKDLKNLFRACDPFFPHLRVLCLLPSVKICSNLRPQSVTDSLCSWWTVCNCCYTASLLESLPNTLSNRPTISSSFAVDPKVNKTFLACPLNDFHNCLCYRNVWINFPSYQTFDF